MTKSHQNEPFFIPAEVEAGLAAGGYEFEPPNHARTISLPDILAGLTDAELLSTLSREELERRKAV